MITVGHRRFVLILSMYVYRKWLCFDSQGRFLSVLHPLCVAKQVVSGILASVDGDKLVTGKSWKCTTRSVAGWMSESFDDNSWPEAVIAGSNTPSDIHGNLAQIHSSANWIWTSYFKEPQIDSTVFCRGYLGRHSVFE